MNAALCCPAGDCEHTETYDSTHQTADPADPASADIAYDALVEHLTDVHFVPSVDVGRLASQARRTTTNGDTHS